ncbi:uncharacterized protein EI97DRAFT_217765 [Westerdykella ornata]|uniref:C2H2-type domain-containing protein n=1 Tax=Westerdykella ornata TaxID=318751 RepID=A0A6A6JQB5_WESOR|nr:uncharacterized protein EI97DRAFT_217765 [Westerdykella ornata]KAF2278732.1 hypothetical protein EI97DRAFT_217765 [Westerdykella ornata]
MAQDTCFCFLSFSLPLGIRKGSRPGNEPWINSRMLSGIAVQEHRETEWTDAKGAIAAQGIGNCYPINYGMGVPYAPDSVTWCVLGLIPTRGTRLVNLSHLDRAREDRLWWILTWRFSFVTVIFRSFFVHCSYSVWTLTPALSESCFDAPLPDFPLFPSNQAVNIAKWSEDVSGAAFAGLDLFCASPVPEMNGADAFEQKHETASVYSMDSAYQSQSGASRSGAQLPEGYQSLAPQDNRSRMNSQFPGSDVYSPTLSSDNFGAFADQHSEMAHVQPPSAAGDMETGDNPFAYANYTTAQDYSHYTATSVPRFIPSTNIDMTFPWGTSDSQSLTSPLGFNSFNKSPISIDAALYSNHDLSESIFNTPPQFQRGSISRPRLDTSTRPAAARKSSSYISEEHVMRRQSANDAGFGSLAMSPTSAISAHALSALDANAEKEETASTSLTAQSIGDEDELLSPSDAAAVKNLEEEQGKIARSHPLYQAQPHKDGKYHCPNEGKPGCTHKPTPLKCNYDKYVDSHLKPFRCKQKMCIGVQFSSTACLLRHEREAHGMHGHGSRPHLCRFADCDRSIPGNGFPRRYNLFDHMKRVHDYSGPGAEAPVPAPLGQTAAPRKSAGRKRKSTAEEGAEKRQKVTKPTLQQQLQQRRGQLQEAFLAKKQNIINILAELGGPNDLDGDIQLTKEVVGLHEISAEFKKTFGG